MNDYIVRATAGNGSIRAFAATTRDLVQHAREVHHTSPVASAALGRMLTAAAMMGTMLKGDKDLLTLQVRGEGPLQGIVVTSDSKARRRSTRSDSRQTECKRCHWCWSHEHHQGYRHERTLCR